MKKYGILCIVFVCLILAGWYYLDHAHDGSVLSAEEKKNALAEVLGRSPILVDKKHSTALKDFSGNMFSLQYPADAHVYLAESSQSAKNTLSFGIVDEHIVVSTQVFVFSDALAEYPSVVLRHKQQDIYTESHMLFQGNTCLSYEKSVDTEEKSMFCQKNGKILSFVVSGPDKQQVTTYFTLFSQTIKF